MYFIYVLRTNANIINIVLIHNLQHNLTTYFHNTAVHTNKTNNTQYNLLTAIRSNKIHFILSYTHITRILALSLEPKEQSSLDYPHRDQKLSAYSPCKDYKGNTNICMIFRKLNMGCA